jgi:hypothetical protein
MRRFGSVSETDRAARELRDRFSQHRIIGRIVYQTPARHPREILAEAA